MSEEQLSVLKALLDNELQKGFIQESRSPVSSPGFFVTDPSSQSRGPGQLRLVVDYRRLNSKIALDEFPIPLSHEILGRLGKAAIFTKFDVRSGFANIRVKEGNEWLTAFKTPFGLFEYKVMPMGLATAPTIFQRFINSVLSPFLGKTCFAYLDDIIIISSSVEEHTKHVTEILEALERNDLHLKPKKCAWEQTEVDFLGYTAVAGKGVRMSEDKMDAIRDMEPPKSKADVHSFNGIVNFYSKFIPHFADIMQPLYNLTKKNVEFVWNQLSKLLSNPEGRHAEGRFPALFRLG